jgi:hypothetical protein
MTPTVIPRELFEGVGVVPCGPVPWNNPVLETRSGIYVVARVPSADELGERVEAEDILKIGHTSKHKFWLSDQPVVYVGKATCLRQRLGQFYRHRYGNRSPHRGGQDVLLLHRDHGGTVHLLAVVDHDELKGGRGKALSYDGIWVTA